MTSDNLLACSRSSLLSRSRWNGRRERRAPRLVQGVRVSTLAHACRVCTPPCARQRAANTVGANDFDTWWSGYDGDLRKTAKDVLDWMRADIGTRLSVSFLAN